MTVTPVTCFGTFSDLAANPKPCRGFQCVFLCDSTCVCVCVCGCFQIKQRTTGIQTSQQTLTTHRSEQFISKTQMWSTLSWPALLTRFRVMLFLILLHTEHFILHRLFQDVPESLINRLALIWDATLTVDSPDMIYANPAPSTEASSSSSSIPQALKCKSWMSAHFLAGCLTGMTPNALWPLPNLSGSKKTHAKPILWSVIKGWDAGTTWMRQKLISCVSPSPLTVRLALAVASHLADEREAKLQNQMWCRRRSTAVQTRRRVQNKAFQISMLKDQTVKGDHGDAFWMRWNAERALCTHVRKYELLGEERERHKTYFMKPWDNIGSAKMTASHSWVQRWSKDSTVSALVGETGDLILGGLTDPYFLNKPLSYCIIKGWQSACVSDSYCTCWHLHLKRARTK